VLLRALTADDRGSLASFTCARLGEPWTEAVQQAVREHLADDVAEGRVSAVGLFEDDGALRGVAAWRVHYASQPVLCRGDVVAVAVRSQRRGYGRQLKEAMIVEARSAGAAAISSIVHRENVAMLRLNERLGAVIEPVEDDPDHYYCVIPVR
jgi:GNAT superfamily N-acetyltransferase